MERMFKSYKFRLIPKGDDSELLSKHFGSVRFIYNHFLKEKQEHYLKNKKTLNYHNCSSSLTKLKKSDDFKWLKEINSQSLQQSLKHLETAYGNFFKNQSKFPRFKKRKSNQSFNVPQSVTVEGNTLYIPKFKDGIRFIKHREIKGDIKQATISKSSSGKYYVSILTEQDKVVKHNKTCKSIGIDIGLKDLLVTSEGERFGNPKFFRKYKAKLKLAQQDLSRKIVGSNHYEQQRLKVANIHDKITNCRNNSHHQISSLLISKYDLIALETLNVKGMLQNHCLAKSIADASWSSFVSKLEYKASWTDKTVIKIDMFYPSSKTCSSCGHIKESLSLDERFWTCTKCNKEHDRDWNAALNILQRGMTIQSTGTVDYRHGVELNPEETNGIDVEVSKKKPVRNYVLKPITLCDGQFTKKL